MGKKERILSDIGKKEPLVLEGATSDGGPRALSGLGTRSSSEALGAALGRGRHQGWGRLLAGGGIKVDSSCREEGVMGGDRGGIRVGGAWREKGVRGDGRGRSCQGWGGFR
jgi:hypothetical protein